MKSVTLRQSGLESTVGDVVRTIRRRLHAAGIDSAGQEAGWLVEHALGLSGLQQITERDRTLSPQEAGALEVVVSKREARVPLQYLLGTQEFCGFEFEVNPSVLIPRPETELLVKELVRRLRRKERPVLIDLCTGSGCLAVSLARMVAGSSILASDVSAEALMTAKRNAARHHVGQSIKWLKGDLFAPFAGRNLAGLVDAIVSNPPYIAEADWPTLQPEVREHEPRVALVAGPRGTEVHERLLNDAIPYLKPGGLLLMELGQGQSAVVTASAKSVDAYRSVEVVPDEGGIDRLLVAERAG